MIEKPSWMNAEIVAEWLESQRFHVADYGALDAALHRPFSEAFGVELYPTIWLKAAALLHSVESTHPMMDGNKRTGVILGHALILECGITTYDEPPADEWFDLVISVASSDILIPQIAAELESIYTA